MAEKYVKFSDVIDALECEWGYEGMREDLQNLPAADVAEVVRCRDCNYWTGTEYDGCCIKNGLSTRYAKDFCNYGERKKQKEEGVSDDSAE